MKALSGLRSCGGGRVAVIPALDEEQAIGGVVLAAARLRYDGEPLFNRVIVVDNGSTDATARVAARAGAQVVWAGQRGYGAACLAGVAAAGGADVIVFIDGDASVDLSATQSLLAQLEAGADLVVGARREAARGAMSLPQRCGNRLATALIRLLWRAPVTDLGPFRAIRVGALRRLDMRDRAYGWTVEMQIKALQHGLRVVEVPVRLTARMGRGKISGTLRGVIGAGIGILSMIGRLWLAQRFSRGRSPGHAHFADRPAAAPISPTKE